MSRGSLLAGGAVMSQEQKRIKLEQESEKQKQLVQIATYQYQVVQILRLPKRLKKMLFYVHQNFLLLTRLVTETNDRGPQPDGEDLNLSQLQFHVLNKSAAFDLVGADGKDDPMPSARSFHRAQDGQNKDMKREDILRQIKHFNEKLKRKLFKICESKTANRKGYR